MSQYAFQDQCMGPLSTPEICKMILNDPLEALASYPSPGMEDQASIVHGLMSDFEDIPSGTMVNPDDVCYGGQQQIQGQVQYFYDNGYSSSSFPSSPESLMNAGAEQMNLNSFNMCAPSPAESHFSTDSGASFYNMDQPAIIKQEPIEFPSTIEEINQQQVQQPCQMSYQPQYIATPPQYVEQYTPYQQQQTDAFQVPTTVPTLAYHQQQQPMIQSIQQQPQQQQQQPQSIQQIIRLPTSTSGATVAGRKRSPNGAFASSTSVSESSTSSSSSSATTATAPGVSGTKKARLTKRQKQQLMDKQVDDYTQKNKDLRNQIELLERKVQFCTQFLQKYVSPIVQGRQNTWTPEVVNAVGVEAM